MSTSKVELKRKMIGDVKTRIVEGIVKISALTYAHPEKTAAAQDVVDGVEWMVNHLIGERIARIAQERDVARAALEFHFQESRLNAALNVKTGRDRIEELVREIQIICDHCNYDPSEWLNDECVVGESAE